MPTTPLSGVRISWLMVARNAALALAACSASSRDSSSCCVRSATRSSKCSLAASKACFCASIAARLVWISCALVAIVRESWRTSMMRASDCTAGTCPRPICKAACISVLKRCDNRQASRAASNAPKPTIAAIKIKAFCKLSCTSLEKSSSGAATINVKGKPRCSAKGRIDTKVSPAAVSTWPLKRSRCTESALNLPIKGWMCWNTSR